MAQNLVINGVTFLCPQQGDQNWAGANGADGWMAAVTSGMLQKAGGAFTLTADANFGSSFGLVAPYLKSATANIATAGALRLANTDSIAFRNTGNSADQLLTPGADGILNYAGAALLTAAATATLTNKTMSGSANTFSNIGYASLSLTGAILNADISASAAIALSKLATIGAGTILGNNGGGSAVPAALTAAQALALISPLTTKGDLRTYSTVNTRLGVGSDGTVLTADSTQATGLKWSSPLTNPMTTLGDIIYGGALGATTRLAGDTSNTRKFLREVSSGGVAAAPAWDTLQAGDLPLPTAQSKTTTYTVLSTDTLVVMDCSTTGSFTATLPSAATGRPVWIHRKDAAFAIANTATIARAGSDVIRELGTTATSTTLASQDERVLLIPDGGTTWYVAVRDYPKTSVVDAGFAPSAGFGTVTSQTITRSRNGDRLRVQGFFVVGTAAASTISLALPTGYVIDYTKISTNSAGAMVGTAALGQSTSTAAFALNQGFVVFTDGTTTGSVFITANVSGGAFAKQNGTTSLTSSQPFSFFFEVPITGWK